MPKPTPTPTPVPVETPAAPENSSAGRIKELESSWEGALLSKDTSIIERIVAEDFIGTSSSGKQGDKATLLAEMKRDTNTYLSAVSSDMKVQIFGDNVAVVTGLARETGRTKAGKSFTHSYRFTDTWMLRDGEWKCVAAHAMAVPKK